MGGGVVSAVWWTWGGVVGVVGGMIWCGGGWGGWSGVM